ncbi:MAG TPA: WD40 repeat domain-containing protein [Bauldia sp.]|nr:WD40 repeat domain-containing protein [Bauldia sp.]
MPTQVDFSFAAFVVETQFLGEIAAFALGDGSVRIVAGDAEHRVQVHSGAILSAALSLDGRRFVTGGDDGLVAATDGAGAVIRLVERPRRWIDHVAGGPGDAVAFVTGRQVTVRFSDGRERSLDLPRSAGGIAFAPRGTRLAIARYDGVTLWWPATEAAPTQLDWKGAHLVVSFSPDGKYVVTSMQDNALHGWRLADGKDMRMSGYPAKPRSMSWSAKGRFLATSGANAAVLWPFHHKEGPMGRPPLQLGAREVLATRVACHPKEELVAIGYQDGMVLAVRFADAEEAVLRRPGGGPVSALAWDGGGRRLAVGTEGGAGSLVVIG